ncbi:Sel1 domain containing protein [Acanthamoeba castellanii str. Neff]|uniref:Sel1 domain containing protein n=1 Tax=Acanthamoeba castellanii (strain ATCC 30010 / Neff) TaxID=1257118 RepID=L8GY55_ACACF|nr:Sel1 domain containing protein [Acanthamoeba castellanii str. Neff]ELR17882.1 Sel1 domain containing protein [Acanthamoeba castellanii str. Neff]
MFAWLNKIGGEGGFLTLYAGSLIGGRGNEEEEKQKRWEKEAERFYFRGRRLIAGHRYSQQSNLARDTAKGKDLLARAAEMGHSLAAVDLSCCTKAAVEIYEALASEDNMLALRNLAICFISGRGVRRNAKKGFQMLQQAAAGGCDMAIYDMGVCYRNGDGVKQDLKEAVKFYKKAAERGNIL